MNYKKLKKSDFLTTRNYLLAYIIDIFGCFLMSIFPSKKKTSQLNSILIVRTDYIGDIISTVPAMKLIREKFPKARIFLLGNEISKDILYKNPFINEIFTMDFPWRKKGKTSIKDFVRFALDIQKIRKMRFDACIIFRADIMDIFLGCLTGSKRLIGYGAKGGGFFLTDNVPYNRNLNAYEINMGISWYLGCEKYKPKPEIVPSESAINNVIKLLNEHNINYKDIIVIINPAGRIAIRNWIPERFAGLCEYIYHNISRNIIICGDNGDNSIKMSKDIISSINIQVADLAGKTSFKDYIALLSIAGLLVCVDTSARHISACFGVPTVVIQYAGALEKHWESYVDTERIIRKNTDCSPCYRKECTNRICIEAITKEEVIGVIEKIRREIIKFNNDKDGRIKTLSFQG